MSRKRSSFFGPVGVSPKRRAQDSSVTTVRRSSVAATATTHHHATELTLVRQGQGGSTPQQANHAQHLKTHLDAMQQAHIKVR